MRDCRIVQYSCSYDTNFSAGRSHWHVYSSPPSPEEMTKPSVSKSKKTKSKAKKNVASSNWLNLQKVGDFYLVKHSCEWRKRASRHLKLRIRNLFIGKRDKNLIQANPTPPHHRLSRLQFQNMPDLALVLWITSSLDDILLSIVRWWV